MSKDVEPGIPDLRKAGRLVGQSESTAADHGRIDQMSVFVCVTVETSNVCIPWERGQMVDGEVVSILGRVVIHQLFN